MFTVLNSSQGTIIFIFHCIISKNVRDELLKAIRNHKSRLLSSSGSSSSGGGNHNHNFNSPSSSSSSKTFVYRGTLNTNNSKSKMNAKNQNILKNNNLGSSNSSSTYKMSSTIIASTTNTTETKNLLKSKKKKSKYSKNQQHQEQQQYHQQKSLISFLEYILDLFLCFCLPGSMHRSSSAPSSPSSSTSSRGGSTNLDLHSKNSAILSINENHDNGDETDQENSLNRLLLQQQQQIQGQNVRIQIPNSSDTYQMYQNLNHIQQNAASFSSYLQQQQQQQQNVNNYLTANPAAIYTATNGANFSLIPIVNPTLLKNPNGNVHIFANGLHNHHHPSCEAAYLTNRYLSNLAFASGPNGPPANLILIPSSTPPPPPPALSIAQQQQPSFTHNLSTFKSSMKKKKANNFNEQENQYLQPEEYHYHNFNESKANVPSNYIEVDGFIDDDESKTRLHQKNVQSANLAVEEMHYSNLDHSKLRIFTTSNEDEYSNINMGNNDGGLSVTQQQQTAPTSSDHHHHRLVSCDVSQTEATLTHSNNSPCQSSSLSSSTDLNNQYDYHLHINDKNSNNKLN